MPAKSDVSPWIKLKKSCVGDAEQRRIRLVLCNLDGKDRGPIHPAAGGRVSVDICLVGVFGHAVCPLMGARRAIGAMAISG
jgi:hypothetical protein